MTNKVHDIPTSVSAEQGEVMLDGPDGVAVSSTRRRLEIGKRHCRRRDEAQRQSARSKPTK